MPIIPGFELKSKSPSRGERILILLQRIDTGIDRVKTYNSSIGDQLSSATVQPLQDTTTASTDSSAFAKEVSPNLVTLGKMHKELKSLLLVCADWRFNLLEKQKQKHWWSSEKENDDHELEVRNQFREVKRKLAEIKSMSKGLDAQFEAIMVSLMEITTVVEDVPSPHVH